MSRNVKWQQSKSHGSKCGEKKTAVPVDSDGRTFHSFKDEELRKTQSLLLEWYNDNKRNLPWRQQDKASDVNQRAYRVWVSEIMLQQTQVATVINYYYRWMKKWPRLQDLAAADLEGVNEMWSGLGYYSRGKRLHEGAQKVMTKFNGEVPKSCEELQKQLPGVGKYTAGAIASIAFGQKTGVVDGNVVRVLSRLRMIGADSAAQKTVDAFWDLANKLANCDNPGDLNQALMELGATICSPKTPQCSLCPVSQVCRANAKVKSEKKGKTHRLMSTKDSSSVPLLDIECLAESCHLCLPISEPWDTSLGVQNFPRKAKRKAPREQKATVYVLRKACEDSQYRFLLMQRPQKGLLAGLWEFPSVDMNSGADLSDSADTFEQFQAVHRVRVSQFESKIFFGEVVHIFSHIHQTYLVSMVTAAAKDITVIAERPVRWLTREELVEAAVPTAMRKVFELCSDGKTDSRGVKKKRKVAAEGLRNQQSIVSFLKSSS